LIKLPRRSCEIEKKYEDVFLIIVGTGLTSYEDELKQLVSNLNLNRVKFTGFVSEDEKLELLEHAVLFITISHSDVHTIAAQEALAMGLPIIISKESDWPELSEYKAGITVDTDINSVQIAIKKLLDDKTLLMEYSTNAKRLVKEKFLMDKLIEKYEKMFRIIIEQY